MCDIGDKRDRSFGQLPLYFRGKENRSATDYDNSRYPEKTYNNLNVTHCSLGLSP